jgi:hypothetical protein
MDNASRHLIHVGFPKAASTTLAAWFAENPQLEFAPNGIGGFGNAFEIVTKAARDAVSATWHATSSEELTSPRPSGAFTLKDPGTAPSPSRIVENQERACRILERMFTGATILVVTRGFRAEIASNYSQYIRNGGRLSLPDLYAPQASRLATVFDYDRVVSTYTHAFGDDRVIALPYELLRDDPHGFIGMLEGRLGLEPSGVPLRPLNPSLSVATIHWYRIMSRGSAALAGLAGYRLGSRVYAQYVRLTSRDRLQWPVRLLDHLLPGRANSYDVPDEVVEACRGRAARLGERATYAPYAADYLNDFPAYREGEFA